MEELTKTLQAGIEADMIEALQTFVDKNKTSFKLGESLDTRKVFCTTVLSMLKRGPQLSSKVISFSLNALRIFAREHQGVDEMVSKDGLSIIAQRAELTSGCGFAGDMSAGRLEVIIEATKVLCNIVLNHRHLAPLTAEIGCLEGLASRLCLAHTILLPHDVLFFDLRLLFLITACGPAERVTLREQHNGIPVLHNIIDATLFGPTSVGGVSAQAIPTCDDEEPRHKPPSACADLAPLRDGVFTAPTPITEQQCSVLCEALKILFNQTLYWREEGDYNEEQVSLWAHISHLLKVLLISLPLHRSKAHTDTICHCAEVLVNTPEQCAKWFLLPPEVQVMPTLRQMNSDLYTDDKLYSSSLDCMYDERNMSAVVALVNLLDVQLGLVSDRNHISTVLTALRVLCKGHRSIRRYVKSLILPPLKEVSGRPDEGDSLKSRVVRLMTAGSLGAEEVAAELLFVLCKEKVSRLVKYTGFGNAAGLLLSRGLLGGGKSMGEDQYSSDSETSDTEEYEKMRENIDPVTAAPMKPDDPSPLDHMTDEQKEKEAEELADLFDRLDRHGIIKVMPVDKDGKPVLTDRAKPKPDDENDDLD